MQIGQESPMQREEFRNLRELLGHSRLGLGRAQNRIDSIGQRRKKGERPQASQQEQQWEHHVQHHAPSVELNTSLLPWDRALALRPELLPAGPGQGCWNALLVNKTILSKPT